MTNATPGGAVAGTCHIRGREVGRGQPVYVIAEVGSNHNRDLDQARRMIDVAAEAGVDAVKFQTFYADDFAARSIRPSDYGLGHLYPESEWREVLANRLILPFEWYPELVARIRRHGLDFIVTVHSERSLEFALTFRPDALKVASMDLTHTPLLAAMARTGVPMIISLGMGGWADIERAVTTVRAAGCRDLVLMHCVSEYPAAPEHLNLASMETLARAFDVPVGFSDHSLGVVSAAVGAALGAGVIEKHYTLDRHAPGPDHPFSLEPAELHALVLAVREARAAVGGAARQMTGGEVHNAGRYRRSIVANGDLKAGTVLGPEHIKYQRPATGLPPHEWPRVVGRRLTIDVTDESPILAQMLGGPA